MQQIKHNISLLFFAFIGILPFPILYLLSDIMYLFVVTIGYRKKVIESNLRNSFPNKTENEIKSIKRKYYHHFCDLFLETFKVPYLTEKQINKRIIIENWEYLEEQNRKNKDVVAILAHYGNWEWVPAINLKISSQGCAVYHPLKNKSFDRFMIDLRKRFNSINYPMKSSFRDIMKLKQQNKRYVIGLIADQTPASVKIQYWTQFLNQETPVFLGPEKIATKTNDTVVFFKMSKIKRGHYQLSVIPITEEPALLQEHELTKIHLKILEDIINAQPEFWLWSHKRWKHKRKRA